MAYKIVRCPKCGAIQATSSSTELQCKSCNTSSTMHSEGQWRVEILCEAKDGRAAGYLVRKLKLMEGKK